MAIANQASKRFPAAKPAQKPEIFKGQASLPIAKYYPHLAGAAMVLLIGVLAVRSVIVKEDIAQCSERFTQGMQLGLESAAGAPVSTTDLQARLAGRDWGLVENVKFIKLKDGPASVAMQIALPKISTVKPDDDKPAPKSGMGFTWLVPKVAAARAACLTYSVWLPEDFTFGPGGILPGLFGGETQDPPAQAAKGAFSVRNTWDSSGVARVRTVTADKPAGQAFPIDPESMELPRGRWLRVEQEVVLNQPGESNGALRLWIDGKLKRELFDLSFRASDQAQFRGVVADVHYGATAPAGSTPAPKPTEVRLTPFELRWQ